MLPPSDEFLLDGRASIATDGLKIGIIASNRNTKNIFRTENSGEIGLA